MTDFIFDDFARTTLSSATNVADGTPLTAAQIDRVIEYLKSPGSGPDVASSYADYVANQLQAQRPKLPSGTDYVGFSGTDGAGTPNFKTANEYVKNIGRTTAGIIGDTPWGQFIETSGTAPKFSRIESKFQQFMESNGFEPRGANYSSALRDIMWNAGSPEFMENAIKSNRPIVAFVDGALPNRGFSNFELTTAIDMAEQYPAAHINGSPLGAFKAAHDPLAFARDSAAEYQQLERTLAQSATQHSGRIVTVADIRANLDLADGYDRPNKTVFGRDLSSFTNQSLDEMAIASRNWATVRPTVIDSPEIDAPHKSGVMAEPHAARGPPSQRGSISPELLGSNLPPGARALGVASAALMAYDFGTSGHKWVQLQSQGNTAGADSTAAHFVGRNVGGAVGGFIAGAGVGLATGSWTGPGAIVAGIGGGAIGAYMGDRWAEQKDIERIYTQTVAGRTWTRDPGDPEGRWLHAARQQQVQTSALGGEVEVAPVQTATGQEVFYRHQYIADGRLERQLNYQAANASYELGLANPPPPQNPFRLDASGEPQPPRTPFETERAFVRDAQTGQWHLEIKEIVDGKVPVTRIAPDPVEPERALQLEQQSKTVIAQNAANSPAAIASRYMVAYEQYRWTDFSETGLPPPAIQNARAQANTLQASDGNIYTRQTDGQWVNEGRLLDSTANRNLTEELNLTWQSHQTGLRDMQAMADHARAHPQLEPEGIRAQVAALYQKHGIERSEAQLDAATLAVERNHVRDGLQQQAFTLELMPDPQARTRSADSAIATFADDGGRMVLKSTTTAEQIAQAQALPHPQQAPTPDSPELRIPAQSPQQREAYAQALREANRQGLSAEQAQEAAVRAAAALHAGSDGAQQPPQVVGEAERTRGPEAGTVPQEGNRRPPVEPVEVAARTTVPDEPRGQERSSAPDTATPATAPASANPVPPQQQPAGAAALTTAALAGASAVVPEPSRRIEPAPTPQPSTPDLQERSGASPRVEPAARAESPSATPPIQEARQPAPTVPVAPEAKTPEVQAAETTRTPSVSPPPAPDAVRPESTVTAAPERPQPEGLRLGDRGPDVEFLQHRLQQAGATGHDGRPVPQDGTYGVETEHAVRQVQQAQGLPVTGVADRALDEALAKPQVLPPAVRQPEPTAVVAPDVRASTTPTGAPPEQSIERLAPDERRIEAQAIGEAQRQGASPAEAQQAAAQAVAGVHQTPAQPASEAQTRGSEESRSAYSAAAPSLGGPGSSTKSQGRDDEELDRAVTPQQDRAQTFPSDHRDHALFLAIQQQLPEGTPDDKTAEIMHQAKLGGVGRADQLERVSVDNDRAVVLGKTWGSHTGTISLSAPAPDIETTLQQTQALDQRRAEELAQFRAQQEEIARNADGPKMTMGSRTPQPGPAGDGG